MSRRRRRRAFAGETESTGETLEVQRKRSSRTQTLGQVRGSVSRNDAATSTKEAPWYIIPADDKWYARAAVADIISVKLSSMGLEYPKVDKEREKRFAELVKALEEE